MPTWSGTRAKLENDYLAPSLRGRLRYFAATYNKSHDREGRASLILDGKEILKSNFFDYSRASSEAWKKLCKERRDLSWRERNELSSQQALEEGCFDQWAFYTAFQEFSNQSIEKSLESKDAIVRMFALLDGRMGKRRLLALRDSMKREPDFLRRIYSVRLEAEGLTQQPQTDKHSFKKEEHHASNR